MVNNSLKNDLKKVETEIKLLFKFEDTGHDISHIKRVLKYATTIQKYEGGDLYIISISAMVHDIHRLISKQKNEYTSPHDCLEYVEFILNKCNIEKEKIPRILEIVKNHEDKNLKDLPIEDQIVQDADFLDSIGKTGLRRLLKYNNSYNIPITNEYFPLDSTEYIPDINPISACHYLYRTILPNVENIHTTTAIKLAQKRINILKIFIDKHTTEKH